MDTIKHSKQAYFFKGRHRNENNWQCNSKERAGARRFTQLTCKGTLSLFRLDEVICFICCFCSVECTDWNRLISSEYTRCCKYYADAYFEVSFWLCPTSPSECQKGYGDCGVYEAFSGTWQKNTHILFISLAGWLSSIALVLEGNTPLWIFGITLGMWSKVARFNCCLLRSKLFWVFRLK